MTPTEQAQHDFKTGGTNPYRKDSREYAEYQAAMLDLYQQELSGRNYCVGCEE